MQRLEGLAGKVFFPLVAGGLILFGNCRSAEYFSDIDREGSVLMNATRELADTFAIGSGEYFQITVTESNSPNIIIYKERENKVETRIYKDRDGDSHYDQLNSNTLPHKIRIPKGYIKKSKPKIIQKKDSEATLPI